MTEGSNTQSSSAAPDDGPLDKVVRIGMLMDLYGGLLTERQRQFVLLHYDEDLSFGEIAQAHGVSRQAIHDAVKHAEQSLEEYESKLRLMEQGYTRTNAGVRRGEGDGDDAGVVDVTKMPGDEPLTGIDLKELKVAVGRLRDIQARIKRSGGVLYNADGIARELDEVAGKIDALLPTETGSGN